MKKGRITGVIICFVMSVGVFFLLTIFQREILKDTERKEVVIAVKEIPAGTTITAKNVKEYFKIEEISIKLAISSTYTELDSLVGKYTNRNISSSEIIYADILSSDAEHLTAYKKPVEMSVTISVEAAAVAGTIRKGDYINLYTLNMVEGKPVYTNILNAVHVNEAYDESMKKIEMSDESSVALTFTFYVEQTEVSDLLNKLEDKNVYVVKIK